MDWPNDADGDAFRNLLQSGFDFSRSYTVDYNVDFASWPPSQKALELLMESFGKLQIIEPDDDGSGYVQFQEQGKLQYPRVVEVQRHATSLMTPFGGYCDSWGILH